MQEKEELRKKARVIRNSLNIEQISEKIVQNIQTLDVYQKAKNVMIFYPLKHEINLLGLLGDKKNFYLPKVQGKDLLVCPYNKGEELNISAFKTQEPVSDHANPDILDIIFIPALMVDENFQRLGYGGGFYDRFLSKINNNVTKIVTIAKTLIASKLPVEAFDAKIDIIICEDIVKK